MYRILAADQPVRERRNQREHPQYTKPELVATAFEPDMVLGHHQAVGADQVDVLLPLRRARHLQPLRGRLDGRRPGELGAGRSSHRRDLPQTGRPAPGTHPALRPRRADDEQVHRTTARRPRRDPFIEPPSGVRRQPLLRGPVQDPEVPPRLPWPLPRHNRRDRLLPNVLPLVQHRTSPWRDRDAHPGRRASQSNPERAGAARADPSSRLDPSSRTLRSRNPTTGSPSPSRLDQPTCDTHNRRNCSVNRNRHCLKVVDRFRRTWKVYSLLYNRGIKVVLVTSAVEYHRVLSGIVAPWA